MYPGERRSRLMALRRGWRCEPVCGCKRPWYEGGNVRREEREQKKRKGTIGAVGFEGGGFGNQITKTQVLW